MKTILLLISLHYFNFANTNQNPEVINPYSETNFSYSSAFSNNLLSDIIREKVNGNITDSFDQIVDKIITRNPGVQLERQRMQDLVLFSAQNLVFEGDQKIRDEAIQFIKKNFSKSDDPSRQWVVTEAQKRLKHLEVAKDFSKIKDLDEDSRREYLLASALGLTVEERMELVKGEYLNQEDQNEMTMNLISEIMNGNNKTESVENFLLTSKKDLIPLACHYLEMTIYQIAESDDEGTLSNIKRAKEEGYFEPYMEDGYEQNTKLIANAYRKFNDIGVSQESLCPDGSTLKELANIDGIFDFKDIEKYLYGDAEDESDIDTNKPCVKLATFFDSKELLSGCDIARIVSMLEKADSQKNQNNVMYTDSRVIGNCDVTLQTERVMDSNISFFRVANSNGYEGETISTPSNIIHLIMK